MIYKGKGRKEELTNNRFIHCKDWFARAAEGLVVTDGLKPCLLAGSSPYQIGGQPGHRTEEMIFVLKSVIGKLRMENRQIILQSYDVQKFFDKEMIEDAVLTCLRRGAGVPAVRLWYKLNSDTKIQVRTAAGATPWGEVGAVVGQGTIGGALISQAVLDDAVMDSFPLAGSSEMLQYGSVPLAPLMWVDDMLNSCESIEQARQANIKINNLIKERGLNLHEAKSTCLVIGSKKQKERVSAELERSPLKCGDFITKEKQEEKWLGQQLSARGLAASVEATIAAREGKIRAAGLEIVAIVQDWRSRATGGLETALHLWQACCLPSLLAGAATWVEMSAATEKKLNSIQNWFLRLVLQVGPGAPLASLLWDTGLLDMGLMVWREKVMLMHHVRNLGDETLAKQIYMEQKENKWPGLVQETEEICRKLGMESVHTTWLDAKSYKKMLTLALHKENESRIKTQAQNKSKCEKIFEEKYGQKTYLKEKDIEKSRFQYKSRFKLLSFAGNFGNDKRFAKSDWLCRCKTTREEESHLMEGSCTVYGHIRRSFGDLKDEEELILFFKEVMEERERLEDEEEKMRKNPSGGDDTADTASGEDTSPQASMGSLQTSLLHVL